MREWSVQQDDCGRALDSCVQFRFDEESKLRLRIRRRTLVRGNSQQQRYIIVRREFLQVRSQEHVGAALSAQIRCGKKVEAAFMRNVARWQTGPEVSRINAGVQHAYLLRFDA